VSAAESLIHGTALANCAVSAFGGLGAGGDFEARAAVFSGNKPFISLFQRKKSI
jgi:hypothetical protein